jgi:hypothetical protein
VVAGRKAWTRDRIARVADWAWPCVEAHLATVLPGERIFRGVDRYQATDVHRERLRDRIPKSAIGGSGLLAHVTGEKRPATVANPVAMPEENAEKLHEEAPATDWAAETSDDSRGGTRTRDPGIMSAVL